MTQKFSKSVLISNHQSGSYDAATEEKILQLLIENEIDLVRHIIVPQDDVPSAETLKALAADLLIVWTGDGTINTASRQATGWEGALLPLPGGTLNLLSKALHGDRPPLEILTDALSPTARVRKIPIVQSGDHIALITILAGPATRWAEVRETMRQEGVVSATREAPEAMEAMLRGEGVRISGSETEHPAIILTPRENSIEAHGILADGAWDMLRHGLAWLSGDFRDGPSQLIADDREITLESAKPISVEFDGELTEISSPATFRLGKSQVGFVATS